MIVSRVTSDICRCGHSVTSTLINHHRLEVVRGYEPCGIPVSNVPFAFALHEEPFSRALQKSASERSLALTAAPSKNSLSFLLCTSITISSVSCKLYANLSSLSIYLHPPLSISLSLSFCKSSNLDFQSPSACTNRAMIASSVRLDTFLLEEYNPLVSDTASTETGKKCLGKNVILSG